MSIPKPLLATAAALVLSSAPAAGQGRWLASYPEARDPSFVMMQQTFAQGDVLASMLEPLNEHFPVSRDVTVEVAECGRAGAFYDPSRPAVQLCYELVMELANELMDPETGDQTMFVNAFVFVLLHQVGHAMVDVLKLQVGVPAEEAADQFAIVMAGYAGEALGGMADGAAALRDLEVDWENPGSGRAVMTEQRVSSMACLLYGSNPDSYAHLVDAGLVDADNGDSCEDAYAALAGKWTALLEEHIRG